MKKDYATYRGKHESFQWLATSADIPELYDLLIRHHSGLYAYVTSFDSGKLQLSPEEARAGWTHQNGVAVSPAIRAGNEVPFCESYDEWWILQSPTVQIESEDRGFVNYVGFTITTSDQHPETGPDHYQQQFWGALARYMPITYMASNGMTNIATRNGAFFEKLSGLV